MAMVPDREWRMPTLMVSAAQALDGQPADGGDGSGENCGLEEGATVLHRGLLGSVGSV
jgi:hypothetical protein